MATVDPLPYVLLTARAREAGVGRKLLSSPAYAPVRRGAWVPGGVDREHPDTRIAAVAAQLPAHAVLGGWAAGRLHEKALARDGLEVFDGSRRWEETTTASSGRVATARVVVCAGRNSRLVRRADVRILRSELRPEDRTTIGGAPVTTALRTAFDCARLLPFARAVVALDRLVHLGAIDVGDLAALVDRRRGWTGRPSALRALHAVDGRAESPQETLLRLLWVDGGFPRPVTNHDVMGQEGAFVARVDLLDPDVGVVGEYDGVVHSDHGRRAADARRQEALEDLGLVVVRATAADLRDDVSSAQWQGRLRAAYRRAAMRPAGRRRWRTRAPRT